MGGSGGDGGYEARQQGIETNKQKARDALNVMFGAPPSATGPSAQLAAPDRAAFTKAATEGSYAMQGENGPTVYTAPTAVSFDEAGYNKAQAEYNAAQQMGTQARQNASSRDSLYQTVRDNAYTAGKRGLDENYGDAKRKTKFELFARGLSGGSEDVDQNAKIGRTYSQGVLDLGAKADAAKAGFRNEDEQTRLQLLQSIDNGMDQGSALSAATNRMGIAADQAASDAQGTALGNVFDTAGLIYQKSQASQGRQAAQDWWNQYQSSTKRSGTGSTGTLSNGSAYN